jgi:hypothetical protein
MIRTQDTRLWTIGGALATVVLAAAGWFMAVHPVLADTADVKSQTASTLMQNDIARTKVAQLAAQHAKVGALSAELRAAIAALPLDNGLPAFTRQLSAQASANHVQLGSVTVGSIAPMVATAAAAATPAATPATTDPAATPAAPATGTADPGALVAIQITVNSTGTATRQLAFLHAIRVTGARRALVTSTNLAVADGQSIDGTCTMTNQITIFSAPRSAAAQAQLQKLLNSK